MRCAVPVMPTASQAGQGDGLPGQSSGVRESAAPVTGLGGGCDTGRRSGCPRWTQRLVDGQPRPHSPSGRMPLTCAGMRMLARSCTPGTAQPAHTRAPGRSAGSVLVHQPGNGWFTHRPRASASGIVGSAGTCHTGGRALPRAGMRPSASSCRRARPTVTLWTAISGRRLAWRSEFLPQELGYGSGMTCWRRLRDWHQAGVWYCWPAALRKSRSAAYRHWSTPRF